MSTTRCSTTPTWAATLAAALELDRMSLSVPEAEGVDVEARARRKSGNGGGIESTRQEDDGRLMHGSL